MEQKNTFIHDIAEAKSIIEPLINLYSYMEFSCKTYVTHDEKAPYMEDALALKRRLSSLFQYKNDLSGRATAKNAMARLDALIREDLISRSGDRGVPYLAYTYGKLQHEFRSFPEYMRDIQKRLSPKVIQNGAVVWGDIRGARRNLDNIDLLCIFSAIECVVIEPSSADNAGWVHPGTDTFWMYCETADSAIESASTICKLLRRYLGGRTNTQTVRFAMGMDYGELAIMDRMPHPILGNRRCPRTNAFQLMEVAERLMHLEKENLQSEGTEGVYLATNKFKKSLSRGDEYCLPLDTSGSYGKLRESVAKITSNAWRVDLEAYEGE